jgi:hypothetical protein
MATVSIIYRRATNDNDNSFGRQQLTFTFVYSTDTHKIYKPADASFLRFVQKMSEQTVFWRAHTDGFRTQDRQLHSHAHARRTNNDVLAGENDT